MLIWDLLFWQGSKCGLHALISILMPSLGWGHYGLWKRIKERKPHSDQGRSPIPRIRHFPLHEEKLLHLCGNSCFGGSMNGMSKTNHFMREPMKILFFIIWRMHREGIWLSSVHVIVYKELLDAENACWGRVWFISKLPNWCCSE